MSHATTLPLDDSNRRVNADPKSRHLPLLVVRSSKLIAITDTLAPGVYYSAVVSFSAWFSRVNLAPRNVDQRILLRIVFRTTFVFTATLLRIELLDYLEPLLLPGGETSLRRKRKRRCFPGASCMTRTIVVARCAAHVNRRSTADDTLDAPRISHRAAGNVVVA